MKRARQQIGQEIACLEELERLGIITPAQRRELNRARWKLRLANFGHQTPWVHVGIIIMAILQFSHLNHLYKAQAIRSAAGRVKGALLEMETEQRGYLLTGSNWYMADYVHNGEVLKLRLRYLCLLMPQTVGNEHLCGELSGLIKQKVGEMDETITLANTGHVDQALTIVRTDKGLGYMREITKRLDLIRTEQGGGDPSDSEHMQMACLVGVNL